jgi:hypothetical protein
MRFRVTRHTAVKPAEHVLDLLVERLPTRQGDVIFETTGSEIHARLDRDEAVWETQDERLAIGRTAVLAALGEVCDRSPELKLDWFAVSAGR